MSTNQFCGHLTADSPLRKAFPRGIVPLTGPHPVKVTLDEALQEVYLIDLAACTRAEKIAMAMIWVDGGNGSYEKNLAFLDSEKDIPARTINFAGVGFAPREGGA